MTKKRAYITGAEVKKYTVWVGGTEITDSFVTYTVAKLLLNNFTNQGYSDVVIQSRRKPHKPT
jgi:hypothetical protein